MPTPRLIIVDDNIDFGHVIGEIAEFIGYESEFVTSIEQFHETYAKYPYDIVTADIAMPGSEGFGLINELIKINCKSRIIIISGLEEELLHDAEQYATDKGLEILAVMRKPFEIDEFEKILLMAKS